MSLLVLSTTVGFAQPNKFSVDKAPNQLSLFADGFTSTHINERDFAMSPDGKEIYFTIASPRSDFQTSWALGCEEKHGLCG